MVCPCCGSNRDIDATLCPSCGARSVGMALAPPDVTLPRLGPAFAALAIPLLVIASFVVVFLLGSDMKVLRVLLVTVLGESVKLTRDWLSIDPRLLSYRIFTFDAYRLAFYLSAVLVPLSFAGIWLARRAMLLIRDNGAGYGGRRIARFSWALSMLLFVSFSAAALTSIPAALDRGREKRMAATRAQMYQLHEQLLHRYYLEYGTYPQELSDLNRVTRGPIQQTDYWERGLSYAPGSVIASKGGVIAFSNYKLVSAGSDGKFGTEDDITMIDGVIVSTPYDSDPQTGLSEPARPRQ